MRGTLREPSEPVLAFAQFAPILLRAAPFKAAVSARADNP
jgi:hypothetical protein